MKAQGGPKRSKIKPGVGIEFYRFLVRIEEM